MLWDAPDASKAAIDTASVDLSSRRTGMSFQRTRLSADRTLMSVIRTSLSLISFGFTIYQVFHKLADQGVINDAGAPRTFGVSLLALGIALLVLGIVYHLQFMAGLRAERRQLAEQGLIHAESHFPPSMTLVTAVALLLIGIVSIIDIARTLGGPA